MGQGGNATVLVVIDPVDGSRHALKILRPIAGDDAQLGRLRREFRTLSRLLHPNILRVEETGVLDGRPWFTMELVEGRDLRVAIPTWLGLAPDQRFATVQGVLVQLGRALAAVHALGLVHRDISPANVLLTHEGVVKLADFGLVADGRTELTREGEILGTVAHSAPEQLRGEPTDARSDLYALGTVLYQMLTGRKPFQAHTVQGWVEAHLYGTPRPPRELDPRIPELLEAVCLRLLEKDPGRRFASARHLLQVLGDDQPVAAADRWPPREVGRDALVARLKDALDELLTSGTGAAVLLTGSSGSGKSRMLDRVQTEAALRGLRVARAGCALHDRAYGPFVPIFEALRDDDPAEVLARAFAPDAPAAAGRYPVLSAFRDLVVARAPCVLLIDHVERAEPATLQLLDYLVRNTRELAQEAVLLVLAADPGPTEPAFGPAMERHALGPLSLSEVEELVGTVLGASPDTPRLAARLYEETGGRAAQTSDALRALMERGYLVRDASGAHLSCPASEIDISALAMPNELRAGLLARVQGLPEAAREVGRVLALARSELDLDVLVPALSLPEADVLAGLDALIDAGMATDRHLDDRELVALAHARFRECLLDGVDEAGRRARHRALAVALEDHLRYAIATVAEALAWHFEEGGVPAKAYAYLAHVAHGRMRNGLYEEALSILDRALVLEPEARPHLPLGEADRQLVELRIARCRSLYHLGRWEEAEVWGRAALQLAERVRVPDQLARVRTRLGYVLRSRGRLDEAEGLLARALLDADTASDTSLTPRPLYHLGAIAWTRGNLDRALELWTRSLDTARLVGDRRAEGMAHNGLGIVAASRGVTTEARRLWEVAADLFREVGMVDYLVIVQINLVELLIGGGALHRAGQLIDRTLARAREVDHRPGIALALLWRARWLRVLGRPEAALDAATEAARFAEAVGSPDERVHALLVAAGARLELGDGAQAELEASEALSQLPEDDPDGLRAVGTALLVRALVARGAVDEAVQLLGRVASDARFPHVQVRSDLELAAALVAVGDPEAAAVRARSALQAATSRAQRLDAFDAHALLTRCLPHGPEREAHVRQARSLLRSLAATLPRLEAESFQRRGQRLLD